MNIPLNIWLKANGRKQALPGDKWYLDFAALLLPTVRHSALYKDSDADHQMKAALALTLYFQDAIAQSGGWKQFSRLYQQRYGHPVPFHQTSSAYVNDEINPEDVALVLWTQLACPARKRPDNYTLFNPEDEHLMVLSETAYDLMDTSFEEAPVNDTPSAAWMKGTEGLRIESSPLPATTPNPNMDRNALRCLEYSGGYPLLFFADYAELYHFFINVLGWKDNPSAILPDLANKREFVIYANSKGMLLAHSVAAYFCDGHNPLYDPARATEEGYQMFCQPGRCPFDLLKLGMTMGLLPDVRFPFHNGKALLQENWDFVARYYLGEYYEGQ